MHPEPLTHCTLDGVPYQRSPEVEAQIVSALALPARTLIAHADGRDPAAPTYLNEESLVYLIRHFHRVGQADMVRDLSAALVHRCSRQIYGKLASLGPDMKDDGYNAVLEQLFTRILTLDSNRGDFFQVRFWPTLKYLIVDVFRSLVLDRQRTQDTLPLSALAGYDADDTEDAHGDARQRAPDIAPPVAPLRLSPEMRALTRDALLLLKPPYRDVFVLYHYEGWPIEASDPTAQCLSRLLGKSPRTIRHWLHQAEQVLEDWRGESE